MHRRHLHSPFVRVDVVCKCCWHSLFLLRVRIDARKWKKSPKNKNTQQPRVDRSSSTPRSLLNWIDLHCVIGLVSRPIAVFRKLKLCVFSFFFLFSIAGAVRSLSVIQKKSSPIEFIIALSCLVELSIAFMASDRISCGARARPSPQKRSAKHRKNFTT